MPASAHSTTRKDKELQRLIKSLETGYFRYERNADELTKIVSIPLTAEQSQLLEATAEEFITQDIFRQSGGADNKTQKFTLIRALVKSGFLRVDDIGKDHAIFITPRGNILDTNTTINQKKDKLHNFLRQHTRTFSAGSYTDRTQPDVTKGIPALELKKDIIPDGFTVEKARLAYGIGLAPQCSTFVQWRGHEERFVELLHQLPTHIATHYQNLAAPWLLPHMLTRDEVNDRPAPLKDWVAKVSANENCAPAEAVAVRGGV